MSNEIAPQVSQAPQPAPQTSKTKKILAGLLAVAVLATGAFFYNESKSEPAATDAPPQFNLEFEGNKLGGLLADNISCRIPGYEFTQDRVNSFQAPALPANQKYELKAGVHLFHSDREVSVQDIIRKIVPTQGNKVMFVIYNPANNVEKKFSLYPPIASPAVISINDPASYKVPANNGIAIISCQNTHIWEIKPETVAGVGLPANIATTRENWILASASAGMDLSAYEITSVWPQSGEGFTFANSVDPNSQLALNNYYMVWLKVKGPKVAAPPVVQPERPDNQPVADASVANILQSATCTSTTFNRLGNPLREGQFTLSPPSLQGEGWNWSWNFGNGQTANTKAATVYHAYAAAGNYTASVTVSKSGLERVLQCAPVAIAAIQAQQNAASCANLNITAKENNAIVPPPNLIRGKVYEISASNFSDDPTARVNLRVGAAYGQFLVEPSAAPLTKANQNIVGFASKTLNPNQKTYFVVYQDAPVTATTITATTTGFASNCSDTLAIPAVEPPVAQAACNSLDLVALRQNTTANTLERGRVYEISTLISPFASNANTPVTVSAFASYGKFTDSLEVPNLNKPASTPGFATKTLNPDQKTYFAVYNDGPATQSALTATTVGLASNCTDNIPIAARQPAAVCEPVNVIISQLTSADPVNNLRRGMVYKVNVALPASIVAPNNQISLDIDPRYGTLLPNLLTAGEVHRHTPAYTNDDLMSVYDNLPIELTNGNTSDTFYFYIYANAPQSALNGILDIETMRLTPNCTKAINIGSSN